MARFFFSVFFSLLLASNAFGDATIPTADKKGARDSPLLKRYEGSHIVAHELKSFDEISFPLSPLEEVEGKRDKHNNRYFEPKEKKALEGARTRLVYLIPENRSPLEVLRNYQEEIRSRGGRILYECKDAECGGDSGRSSSGGGGEMSLAMFLFPQERITDPAFSNGHCAMTERIVDQRYAVVELPAEQAHVSILTYTLKAGSFCKAFAERTIAVVDILESKDREQNMVTVKAEEMASRLTTAGSVALYGIHFDFNKADVKPESEPTLQEIAKLLKADSSLKLLVVGHTDNVGLFTSNMTLSQRRADAVVTALASRHGVDKSRLTPVGVSFACPVAPNTTDEGRARNRRVELVKN
jgi:outer membrane protein OmpA-like peptidoglycan-associated protein